MTNFKTRKSDGQVFPTDRKTSRDSGNPSYVGMDKSQIEYEPKSMSDYTKNNPKKTSKPKNPFAKQRDIENPYEIWDSPDGKFELRVLKKNQVDDNKPYASYYVAVKSPYTFGSWEYGDQYVKSIKSGYKKRQRDDVGQDSKQINVHTSVAEEIKIDAIVKKNSKAKLLDEIEEFGIKKDVRKVLSESAVKHPESNELKDYSHRAVAYASFVVNRNKQRKPKTKEVFVIQGNYGSGWEDVTEEEKYSEARARLKEYNENEPQYAHRKITRRVKNE